MRGVGLGAAYSIARVAGVGTPYVVRVLSEISIWIPIFIFTGFCALATIASLILPIETFNRGLADTLHSMPTTSETDESGEEVPDTLSFPLESLDPPEPDGNGGAEPRHNTK